MMPNRVATFERGGESLLDSYRRRVRELVAFKPSQDIAPENALNDALLMNSVGDLYGKMVGDGLKIEDLGLLPEQEKDLRNLFLKYIGSDLP